MPTLREAFDQFDADGSGEIDSSELSKALAAAECPVNDAQLSKLLREIDTNKDGKVSFEEFQRFARSHNLVTASGSIDTAKLAQTMKAISLVQVASLEEGLMASNAEISRINLRIKSGEATEAEVAIRKPLIILFSCYGAFVAVQFGVMIWSLVAGPDGLDRNNACAELARWMITQSAVGLGVFVLSCCNFQRNKAARAKLLNARTIEEQQRLARDMNKDPVRCFIACIGCFSFAWLIYGCTLFPMDDVEIYNSDDVPLSNTTNFDGLCRDSQYMAALALFTTIWSSAGLMCVLICCVSICMGQRMQKMMQSQGAASQHSRL